MPRQYQSQLCIFYRDHDQRRNWVIGMFSGAAPNVFHRHADRCIEILLNGEPRKHIELLEIVHGEKSATMPIVQRLREQYGIIDGQRHSDPI